MKLLENIKHDFKCVRDWSVKMGIKVDKMIPTTKFMFVH